MSKGQVLSITLFFLSFIGYSQQHTVVKGRIISATNGDPIRFATITVARYAINSMSNESGEFILKLPGNARDSIHISHVGYQPQSLPVSREVLLIKLHPRSNELKEVVVQLPDASGIVKRAIARIPENYRTKPFTVTGFYRMTGTKEKRIIHMSEAVFDIFSESYTNADKQVKLAKARMDKDLTAFNGNDVFNFGSTPDDVLKNDIVSNSGVSDMLSKKGFENYTFSYKGVIDHNGSDAYVIHFDQKDGVRKSLNQGKMIIDVESLAFVEFDFKISPKGIKYWSLGGTKEMLLRLSSVRIKLLGGGSKLSYRKYGGKYYLNHVQGKTLWHIVGGRDHFKLDPFTLAYNYLVTKIDTTGVEPFDSKEILRHSQFMENTAARNQGDSADPFWEEYNMILPDFNVDSAARIIHANNKSLRLKEDIEDLLSKYPKNKSARIDSILSYYHRFNQFNGNALVQYEGKTILQKSFGPADKERKIANDVNTQFRIGSASKQFMAMLIMQLVAENKLRVLDTVGKFLPEYIHGKVTLQQLMTHQSGIPNFTKSQDYLSKIVSANYSTDQLLNLFCSDSLEFEPGTAFNYSNSGYVVLAAVIENITGKKYGEVLEEKIFGPLGMKNSFFGSASARAMNMAKGYVNEAPEMLFSVENMVGAGCITSTAGDLLRWNHALTSGSLLTAEIVKEIFEPRVEWKEWNADYGYGWMIDKLQFKAASKHMIHYHPGTEPGFYAMVVRQPDKNIVIILLNNKGEFPRFDMVDLMLNELN
jgi:CubicO group peptidase (beta-lactamase class C family)